MLDSSQSRTLNPKWLLRKNPEMIGVSSESSPWRRDLATPDRAQRQGSFPRAIGSCVGEAKLTAEQSSVAATEKITVQDIQELDRLFLDAVAFNDEKGWEIYRVAHRRVRKGLLKSFWKQLPKVVSKSANLHDALKRDPEGQTVETLKRWRDALVQLDDFPAKRVMLLTELINGGNGHE